MTTLTLSLLDSCGLLHTDSLSEWFGTMLEDQIESLYHVVFTTAFEKPFQLTLVITRALKTMSNSVVIIFMNTKPTSNILMFSKLNCYVGNISCKLVK